MDDSRYINSLIAEGEHEQQDFKYKVMDAEKLSRSVSAFANTSGGRLLIGVRDDGHISGVRSEEEIYMMHAAAYEYCRPSSNIHFDTYHIGKRTIVIATIPRSSQRETPSLYPHRRREYHRLARTPTVMARRAVNSSRGDAIQRRGSVLPSPARRHGATAPQPSGACERTSPQGSDCPVSPSDTFRYREMEI